MSSKAGGWQFFIDRGGTFTDVIGRRPWDRKLVTHKLLSEAPNEYPDAALEGIRRLMAEHRPPVEDGEPFIEVVKMGTTVATNALLERKGEPTVLVITAGHGDALRIGYQARPRLFDLRIELPEQLYRCVVQADERVDWQGTELRPLDAALLERDLRRARDEHGCTACAVVFCHGYRAPAHEQQAAEVARRVGFTQVSVSHVVAPLRKLVSRGDTTVVDAYLSPVLRRYVDQVGGALGDGPRLQFMQSSGGLSDAHLFQGKDAILSGPAGGLVGAVHTGARARCHRLITFDMGGTSTDVAHFNRDTGGLERAFETQVAGIRLRAPMMLIHTVAAGGGSVCRFDGARFCVGPESAGAQPGPAAYRCGGPLTVTDCNVLVGKLQPDLFPHVFGPTASESLDVDVVRRLFQETTQAINEATAAGRSPGGAPMPPRSSESVAEGFLTVAVENMANAIKKVSVERGYDVTNGYVLHCFGGAGGQHACAVADALGMRRVLIHPLAGLLSAHGMGLANVRVLRSRAVEVPLTDELLQGAARAAFAALEREADQAMRDQAVPEHRVRCERTVHVKYEGTDSPLVVPLLGNIGDGGGGGGGGGRVARKWGKRVPFTGLDVAQVTADFLRLHRAQFGFEMAAKRLVVEAASVELIGAPDDEHVAQDARTGGDDDHDDDDDPAWALTASAAGADVAPIRVVDVFTGGQWRRTPVYQRDQMLSHSVVDGPAIICESSATTMVEPGWRAVLSSHHDLMLSRYVPVPGRIIGVSVHSDPVYVEVFNNLFMSIAEQMGVRLRNTATSINIKERLDFSCAVFDRQCNLIANAPHMPVHLGSMGESVRALVAANGGAANLRPNDVFMLNSPFAGGTHLPDITVVTPVFIRDRDGGEKGAAAAATTPVFYVASRGHHADVGGVTPGSMPPMSRTIDEEGVLIENFLLVDRGQFRETELLELMVKQPRYPARNPPQTVADLRAQVAANEKGVQELNRVVRLYGLAVVTAYMGHVQDNAEEHVRRVLAQLPGGQFRLTNDNGSVICVRIDVNRAQRTAVVDFEGSSGQLQSNFNAPAAVVRAAVLYVMRTLVDANIPMNDGCLRPVEIRIPERSMLAPEWPAAVVAGNVEVSQCVTDALYGALDRMASAQGTMNNFTFGDEQYQYYETICGGSGAGMDLLGRGFDGTSAVQTHMTNSRLTDLEVLECRFPVRVELFEIRRGSGGRGHWSGGDGVRRRIRFLRAMTAAILSNRRTVAPFGLRGGQPGQVGQSWVERAETGERVPLSATDSIDMAVGDQVIIETPGGGGFGDFKRRDHQSIADNAVKKKAKVDGP